MVVIKTFELEKHRKVQKNIYYFGHMVRCYAEKPVVFGLVFCSITYFLELFLKTVLQVTCVLADVKLFNMNPI